MIYAVLALHTFLWYKVSFLLPDIYGCLDLGCEVRLVPTEDKKPEYFSSQQLINSETASGAEHEQKKKKKWVFLVSIKPNSWVSQFIGF